MYKYFFKRFLDIVLSLIAMILLLPLLLILTFIGVIKMGGNPFFTQYRPGKNEKIFKLIKFRTMNNKKDKEGNFLSDEERLTKYGKTLRATSLDELPELINILIGDMAIIGPRPQLVKDMVFMTNVQRQRHSVRQGLTGLAQVNGRNSISWEDKIEYDLKYIERITFIGDIKILFKTITKVFIQEGITEEGLETTMDLGDYLLLHNRVSTQEYKSLQQEAIDLINKRRNN